MSTSLLRQCRFPILFSFKNAQTSLRHSLLALLLYVLALHSTAGQSGSFNGRRQMTVTAVFVPVCWTFGKSESLLLAYIFPQVIYMGLRGGNHFSSNQKNEL